MDKRLKNISKVSVALALCGASATATIAIPKTDNVMEELFENDSDYKKYNLNTFEWHYNDNLYTVNNIRK